MFCDRHSQQRKRKNDLCQIKWQTDRRIFPQAKCVISFSPPLFILYVSPCSFVVYVHNAPPVAFSFAVVSLSIDCFHMPLDLSRVAQELWGYLISCFVSHEIELLSCWRWSPACCFNSEAKLSTNTATLFATDPIRSWIDTMIHSFAVLASSLISYFYSTAFDEWLCFLEKMTTQWLIARGLSLLHCPPPFSISIYVSGPKKKEIYLYLGLPHQHIPINKAGGEVAAVAGSGGGKCGPEAERWACAK